MTNSVKSITDDIINTLKGYDDRHLYEFKAEFESVNKPCPLIRPTAVFGIKEICMADGGFGEYLGTDSQGNTVMGKRCDITVNIRLFMPRDTAQNTGSFFETIASVLSACPLSSGIISMSIGETSSDKLNDCFTAKGEIKLHAIFNTVSSKETFASSFCILNKGE